MSVDPGIWLQLLEIYVLFIFQSFHLLESLVSRCVWDTFSLAFKYVVGGFVFLSTRYKT